MPTLVSPGKMIATPRRNRRARSSFSPSKLSWLGWYDETSGYDKDDGMGGYTPVTANNNACIRWRDKSGNAKHLTGPGATYKSASGGYLDFDGVANYLAHADLGRTNPSTLIVVASATTGFDGTLLDGGTTINTGRVFVALPTFPWPSMYASSGLLGDGTLAFDTLQALGCVFNGADSKLFQSALTPIEDSLGTGIGAGVSVGAYINGGTPGGFWTGIVKALWVAAGAMSDENMANMLNYIGNRYTITIDE